MKGEHLQTSYTLLQRAIGQEFTAAMAAEAAEEAERTGHANMAEPLWTLMHRCRASAKKLRATAQVEAGKARE